MRVHRQNMQEWQERAESLPCHHLKISRKISRNWQTPKVPPKRKTLWGWAQTFAGQREETTKN